MKKRKSIADWLENTDMGVPTVSGSSEMPSLSGTMDAYSVEAMVEQYWDTRKLMKLKKPKSILDDIPNSTTSVSYSGTMDFGNSIVDMDRSSVEERQKIINEAFRKQTIKEIENLLSEANEMAQPNYTVCDVYEAEYKRLLEQYAPATAESFFDRLDRAVGCSPSSPSKVAPKPLIEGSTIRKRLTVTPYDFAKYTSDEEVQKIACQIVLTTNVDDLRYEYVLDIGKETQNFHQTIIDCIFDVSNHTALNGARVLIAKIVSELESLSQEKGWFKKSKVVDFNDVQARLREYTKDLSTDKTKDLKDLKKYAEDIMVKIVDLKKSLEPYVVVVSYFSEYKKDHFPSELFISRLGSLSSTLNTLSINKQQVDMLDKLIIGLLDTINNIILTELPIWSTSYLTMSLQKTQDAALETQRINLINNIKQKL